MSSRLPGKGRSPRSFRRTPLALGRSRILSVRRACSTFVVISAERAAVIERELASLCGVEPDELRDYLRGYVKSGRARRTGFTFVRGTHGGTYVLDPEGVDELPAGNAIRPNA